LLPTESKDLWLFFGGTMVAVNPKQALVVTILVWACCISAAQSKSASMPESLVIARDTFWDMGPPFDYYDLIQIKKTADGLSLDQVLVTPHGMACLQPATVEERSAVLHNTMSELLEGKNPCAIPDKDLHREIKRCKKCPVFSGVNVTMQASCNGKDRQLQMNILDRDIYDSRTPTPTNTSWSMRVLSTLNDSLGPSSEDKPIFQIGVAPHHDFPNTPLVNAIRDGRFDDLFGNDSGVSQIVTEADQPLPPPPSVEIENVTPVSPMALEAPGYPPIAIAARIEGLVHARFDIAADGRTRNIVFDDEARLKMLQGAVSEAILKWNFPQPAWGQSGKVAIRFALNCHDNSR
jgi:TonB family protein